MHIRDLLTKMVELDASDLHLKSGSPPALRINGKLRPVEGREALTPETCRTLTDELLDNEQIREEYEKVREIDFSKGIDGLARFRVNLFHQRGSRAAVLRKIPLDTPVLEDLDFPPIVKELCKLPRGLVLVTGPTGSGKSTTLASMIDYINRTEEGHILTLEDPIEFIHQDKKCVVNQREIGSDSLSFTSALRAALREDPDVILVGEMRDLETICLAITAAETGHLVFGTLHTTSAIQTIDRVIDVFPHDAQQQVRTQLSSSIQGVISQTLLRKVGGGRIAAQEIMIATDAVRSCVREAKTPQLLNLLQTGSRHGMCTLESSLVNLVKTGLVTPDDAIGKANRAASLAEELDRIGFAPSETKLSVVGESPEPAPATQAAAPPPRQPERQKPAAAADPMGDFEQFRKQRRATR